MGGGFFGAAGSAKLRRGRAKGGCACHCARSKLTLQSCLAPTTAPRQETQSSFTQRFARVLCGSGIGGGRRTVFGLLGEGWARASLHKRQAWGAGEGAPLLQALRIVLRGGAGEGVNAQSARRAIGAAVAMI